MNWDVLDLERCEQIMWSNLWRCIDRDTGTKFGATIVGYLDADCLITERVPQWLFNRVIGLGVGRTVNEQDIEYLMDLYGSKGVPFSISLCPNTLSHNLEDLLKKQQFAVANTWVKMVRDNAHPKKANCDFEIKAAGVDQGNTVGEIIAEGFGLSRELAPLFKATTRPANNRVYIAWDGVTPVAVGVLSVVGKIGHLNTATTLSGYRGQGAQASLMAHRIKEGIRLGCRLFVTETWLPGSEINHSYNNMLRQNFEIAYERPNWVLNP